MKSTWFGNRKRFDFAKKLQELSYHENPYNLMSSFITCAFYSLRQAVHRMRSGCLSDEYEEIVVKEQSKYKKHEKLAEALGILVMALEEDSTQFESYDFLGTTMGELEQLNSSGLGQLFTPTCVSKVIAELSIGDAKPDDSRTLMLHEPACGGGSTVISASNILKGKGFWPWHYHWVAVDIDWRCFAMCYIQLTLLGIPATVVHGNTLTLEEFDSATTIAGVLHPPRDRKSGDEEPELDAPQEDEAQEDEANESKEVVQKQLF